MRHSLFLGSFVVKKSGNTELIVAAGGSGGDGSGHNSEPRPKPGGSSDTGDPTQAGQCNSPYASGAGGNYIWIDQENELLIVMRWIPKMREVISAFTKSIKK